MESMVLRTTWNTNQANQDLLDLLAVMVTEDLRVKKVTEANMVIKETGETMGCQVIWDLWVSLDQWVNQDHRVPTVHPDFLVKWVQSVPLDKKENVVIRGQLAIRASKVKKAIKVTKVVGVMWVQQDQFVSKVRKVCSTAATVKA